MKAINAIKFIINNYDVILLGISTILTSLLTIVEVLNRIIPTKKPDSFLTRTGNFLVSAGKKLNSVIDFLKIPNNIKK